MRPRFSIRSMLVLTALIAAAIWAARPSVTNSESLVGPAVWLNPRGAKWHGIYYVRFRNNQDRGPHKCWSISAAGDGEYPHELVISSTVGVYAKVWQGRVAYRYRYFDFWWPGDCK